MAAENIGMMRIVTVASAESRVSISLKYSHALAFTASSDFEFP